MPVNDSTNAFDGLDAITQPVDAPEEQEPEEQEDPAAQRSSGPQRGPEEQSPGDPRIPEQAHAGSTPNHHKMSWGYKKADGSKRVRAQIMMSPEAKAALKRLAERDPKCRGMGDFLERALELREAFEEMVRRGELSREHADV